MTNKTEYNSDSLPFEKSYHKHEWAKSKCIQMKVVVHNVLHNAKKFEVDLNYGLKDIKCQNWLFQILSFV